LFDVRLKLGVSRLGKNVGRGYSRIGCWGGYLGRRVGN